MSNEKLPVIEAQVQKAFQGVLDALLINTKTDAHTADTAKRVAKMYCREIFAGCFTPCPDVTLFPAHEILPYFVGPIPIRSTCAHHFLPIVGKCWLAILPGKEVMGLSKFSRLVDWVASRPQIQEEMTNQIAKIVYLKAKADAVLVHVEAEHSCMSLRGVRETCGTMATQGAEYREGIDPQGLLASFRAHINARA